MIIHFIKYCSDYVGTTEIKKKYVHKVVKGKAEITIHQDDPLSMIK
jgi:hypothetical protein